MKVVECNSLTKVYGSLRALNKLSFDLEENKITGLIGRNGAGKTTLLKIMAGFFRKSSGEIKVFGEEAFNSLRVAQNMIFIDDKMTFPSSLYLADILAAAASFYDHWDRQLAQGLLDYFSLNPNQFYNSLSKGMKSTFNAILGLAARCPLTIFDEPTTGMDAAARKDFYRALLKDYVQHPRTIILSSHHLNEIEHVLEDVLLLHQGEKLLQLPVDDLKELAVGLRGKAAVLEQFLDNKEIYYGESLGKDSEYVVMKNDFTQDDLQKIKMAGVEILPVAANDICIYLTAKHKGGIDDVFVRS